MRLSYRRKEVSSVIKSQRERKSQKQLLKVYSREDNHGIIGTLRERRLSGKAEIPCRYIPECSVRSSGQRKIGFCNQRI